MSKYRNNLPQLSGGLFISHGGLETSLVYREKVSLPCFASFHLLNEKSKYEWIRNYLKTFVNIAEKYNVGYILESNTWRANPDWITKLGYSNEDFIYFNKKSIELLEDIRNEYNTDKIPIILNGCIGPRSDGYNPSFLMTSGQAKEYHSKQIEIFSQTNADMITAFTLTYSEEAIGIVQAAKQFQMPIAISFTLETDGNLPTGQSLKDAIQTVDKATENGPIYYLINCVHPCYFINLFNSNEDWTLRIHGIRGNASKKTHEELDNSKELDSGNPEEFAEYYLQLLYKLKNFNILAGCCGTDYRHAEQICKLCTPLFNQIKQQNQN